MRCIIFLPFVSPASFPYLQLWMRSFLQNRNKNAPKSNARFYYSLAEVFLLSFYIRLIILDCRMYLPSPRAPFSGKNVPFLNPRRASIFDIKLLSDDEIAKEKKKYSKQKKSSKRLTFLPFDLILLQSKLSFFPFKFPRRKLYC